MYVVIYNCKHCKTGRRIEYPIKSTFGGFFRQDEAGKRIPSGVWIDRIGGGMPTIYGGDPLGICATCHRMMSYGTLKAFLVPEHPCDARCTNARGHKCECSCAGKNHGQGWNAYREPQRQECTE